MKVNFQYASVLRSRFHGHQLHRRFADGKRGVSLWPFSVRDAFHGDEMALRPRYLRQGVRRLPRFYYSRSQHVQVQRWRN